MSFVSAFLSWLMIAAGIQHHACAQPTLAAMSQCASGDTSSDDDSGTYQFSSHRGQISNGL